MGFSFMRSRFDLKHIRIKPATPRDTTRLLHLINAYYRFDQIPFDRKAIASGLSLLLNEPALGRVWLILKGGKAVGYLILTFGFDLEFGGRQATLTDLYIKAPHRRKGIGRAVLEQMEDFCRGQKGFFGAYQPIKMLAGIGNCVKGQILVK